MKGFRNILFSSSHDHHSNNTNSSPSSKNPSTSSTPFSSPSRTRPSTPIHKLSESMMEENIDNADSIITKWNPETCSGFAKVSYLFYDDRIEAKQFLKCVKNLQTAMRFFISQENSNPSLLVRAQNLMQIAMKILQKEFYQILSTNRNHLDPESISSRSSHPSVKSRSSTSDYEEDDVESEDEIRTVDDDSISRVEEVATVVMNDLKSIAECMISSGYGKECVRIYKIIRKSIIDESLYSLGVERLSFSQIHKMGWETLDLKIKNWLYAMKIAVRKLFSGERILCDFVFTSENSRESCFSEISKEAAMNLFQFPEFVAKEHKSAEKIFRILDLYDSISELWSEIESIFNFESTSSVRAQAISSLLKLGDTVRLMLSDFESAIQKDTSKYPILGGGLHPLTRYVMNYLSVLSDYSGVLSDIMADSPFPIQTSFPDSYLETLDSNEGETPPVGVHFAWLVLILLCKLDGKVQLYKDVSLSYLFLANNLHYVVSKVRNSNLRFLLGDDWISKHELKVRQYSSNYERIGWSEVISSLPINPTAVISLEVAKECFNGFNFAFETAYKKQSSWVIPDGKLRDEIKVSICKKIIPVYQEFYETNRETLRLSGEKNLESLVKYSPENLGNYLSDLFYVA